MSNVQSTFAMFYYSAFNNDISEWDVSSITRMELMFSQSYMTYDLSNWDVSLVTSCESFNAGADFCSPWFSADTCVTCNCVPIVTKIEGCATTQGMGTYDCNGGDEITVSGVYFGPDMTVLIDGEHCTNVTYDDDILETDVLTCTLPPGSGQSVSVQTSISICMLYYSQPNLPINSYPLKRL